jgi:hypothetical protein
MMASMAAFAIEDAFLKTVTKQLPVGQVLMMFGAAGTLRLCAHGKACWRLHFSGSSFDQEHAVQGSF